MKSNFIPKASPAPFPEFDTFLTPFATYFRRYNSRDGVQRYTTGLLADCPTRPRHDRRGSGGNLEYLEHLLTDAIWDAQALDEVGCVSISKCLSDLARLYIYCHSRRLHKPFGLYPHE